MNVANKTKIEWTECSWNPVTGCTPISAGCQNCYAATFAKRLEAMHNPRYKNGFNVTVHEDLIEAPLRWKLPRKIFVNSMSDLFHESLTDETILNIFSTMNKASWHTFQVLTKRSERLQALADRISWTDNIWMGVTIESQDYLYRAKHLISSKAKIKFISAEPLLTELNGLDLAGLNWIIVGGESGHHCRSVKEEWVVCLRDMAKSAKIPFFFKQWGGANKKKTGRLLEGKFYDEYPNLKNG